MYHRERFVLDRLWEARLGSPANRRDLRPTIRVFLPRLSI